MSFRKEKHLEPNPDSNFMLEFVSKVPGIRVTKDVVLNVLLSWVLIVLGFLSAPLNGQELKLKGVVLIPAATGEKSYPGEITISRTKLTVSCREKIFRPFNCFDLPFQHSLTVDIKLVKRFYIHKHTLFILPQLKFHEYHRNMFHHVSEVSILSQTEDNAIIFEVDINREITRQEIHFLNNLKGNSGDS